MSKKLKEKKTKKQKRRIALKVFMTILIIIALIAGAIAIANIITVNNNKKLIETINPVFYEEQLIPTLDETGCYTFTTDEDLKVMQLTDIHIGSGFLSTKKDRMAINAVAAMISEEKPDLVVVTGDIAFPVPYAAGTFNNKTEAKTFASLMEQLGVYWAPVFGNHDTEIYSYFSRDTIGKVYSDKEKYPHCLFQTGPDDVDGVGNYVIKVKNTFGKITRSLVMLDSHSYIDNDYFGIFWKYDCIHKNQIEWYENQINAQTEENYGATPKSFLFFHIPVVEMRDAYNEYSENGFNDTENTKYMFGKAGEHKAVVYSSNYNNGLVDKCIELGSTDGMFFGHDHLNNISLKYKGIQMTYGNSIDYLAYSNIKSYGNQRGCTLINIKPDGTYNIVQENYYQDKYQGILEKENVTMDDYYADEAEN